MTETASSNNERESPESPFVTVRTPDGDDLVVVANRGVAFSRWCPHKQADLADGTIVGSAIKCPLHGYMFNLTNGRGMNCRYTLELLAAADGGDGWTVADQPVEVVGR